MNPHAIYEEHAVAVKISLSEGTLSLNKLVLWGHPRKYKIRPQLRKSTISTLETWWHYSGTNPCKCEEQVTGQDMGYASLGAGGCHGEREKKRDGKKLFFYQSLKKNKKMIFTKGPFINHKRIIADFHDSPPVLSTPSLKTFQNDITQFWRLFEPPSSH